MEDFNIFELIGLVVVIVSSFALCTFIVGNCIEVVVDQISNKVKFFWRLLEYIYHRKEFKQWVKDKERHPRAK